MKTFNEFLNNLQHAKNGVDASKLERKIFNLLGNLEDSYDPILYAINKFDSKNYQELMSQLLCAALKTYEKHGQDELADKLRKAFEFGQSYINLIINESEEISIEEALKNSGEDDISIKY